MTSLAWEPILFSKTHYMCNKNLDFNSKYTGTIEDKGHNAFSSIAI